MINQSRIWTCKKICGSQKLDRMRQGQMVKINQLRGVF